MKQSAVLEQGFVQLNKGKNLKYILGKSSWLHQQKLSSLHVNG